jgi:signal transduction histidine kinase
LRVQYLCRLSFAYRANDLAAARRYSEQALALARRVGYRTGMAIALESRGHALSDAGDYPAAERTFEQALTLNQRLGRYRGIGNCYLGMGNVNVMLQEQQRALDYYAQAKIAYDAMQTPWLEGQLLVLNNTAGVYDQLKQPARAARAWRQALALPGADTQPRLLVAILRGLGWQQLQAHHLDSAQATLGRGLRLALATNAQNDEAGIRSDLAQLAQQQGHPAEAYAQALQAVQIAQRGGHVAERQDALLALAEAQHALHRPEAYDTLRSYLALHDTLLAQDRTDAIIAGQARFQAAEQQARIRSLEKDKRLSQQAVELAQLRNRQQAFGLGALGVVALALGGGLLWHYRRRQAAHDAALRTQLAADLHDDVGSLLTQISLQSDLLREPSASPAQTLARLDRLSQASRQAARQMADVVWGLHANSATLPEVLAHMRDHAHEVLPAAGLAVDFAVTAAAATLHPAALVCQNLYLIYKEALHNTVKHAHGATQVTIRVFQEAGQLCLSVRDDAPGPAAAPRPGGHGLTNMRQRAEAIGGELRLATEASGFEVVACLPV